MWVFAVVVNLKWGYALSDHPSPLFVSFICILVYFLGDEAIK